MRTRVIEQKNMASAMGGYFLRMMTDSRAMYNTAMFYIRNVMTGLKKAPDERTENEKEVLANVSKGIDLANEAAEPRFWKCCREAREAEPAGGMKGEALMRKACRVKFFEKPDAEHWFLSYETLDAVFKALKNPVYIRMPAQVNQNAIKKCCLAWKAYFQALADWKVCPEKYEAMPRMPRYQKDRLFTAGWTKQVARLVCLGGKAFLQFSGCRSSRLCIGKEADFAGLSYVRTECRPFHGRARVLVSFEDKAAVPPVPVHPDRTLGIDLGLSNFAAVAGNFGDRPFLLPGGPAKALNQWFNKRRASLLSALTRGSDSTRSSKQSHALDALSRRRDNAFRDLFYKYAWRIVRYAAANHVQVIVVGCNKGQKQGADLGRKNNQAFVSIPFDRFRNTLTDLAARCGIPVVLREESYTSLASAIDGDDIPVYKPGDETVYTFSGSRVMRGLYQTKQGLLINADVNGAANILRKEYAHAFEGQDLTYLLSVNVVRMRDMYVPMAAGKKKHKCHRPGVSARGRHEFRATRRIGLLEAFGVSKAKHVCKDKEKAAV